MTKTSGALQRTVLERVQRGSQNLSTGPTSAQQGPRIAGKDISAHTLDRRLRLSWPPTVLLEARKHNTQTSHCNDPTPQCHKNSYTHLNLATSHPASTVCENLTLFHKPPPQAHTTTHVYEPQQATHPSPPPPRRPSSTHKYNHALARLGQL